MRAHKKNRIPYPITTTYCGDEKIVTQYLDTHFSKMWIIHSFVKMLDKSDPFERTFFCFTIRD